jgi:hypothetical protein
LNQARGTKTAYGMLMDRYGSEDAATAAARAAALDYAASKVSQEQASWKGVNAQNQTDQLLAEISKAREMEIANGFKFIPAQSSAPRYQMAFRGHVAPGTFSEEQAKTEWLKHQTEQGEKADETILHGEVQAGVANATERAKAAAEKSNYGPLGKAGTEKMALEQAEAERERNGIVSSIDDSIRNVKAIVRGGIISDAVANALPPSLVSGPTKDLNEREAYNVRAMMAVAAKYKINTDAMEPKNLELLKKYSAPYVIPSGASEDTARNKMALLKRDVGLAARARGVEPSVPAKLPPSARYPGEGK